MYTGQDFGNRKIVEPQEDNAVSCEAVPKYQFAEILIECQDHALFVFGAYRPIDVRRACTNFGCGQDFVSRGSQPRQYIAGDILIGEEAHG